MNCNLNFDIIRAIAIIFVIGIHSLGLVNDALADGDSVARLTNAAMSIVYAGVPLFVMLSGALLLGKDEPINTFFKKRVNRLLLPFFFWSIIAGTMLYLQDGGRSIVICIETLSIKMLTTGVHGIYWYVYMIIGLYLITPFLRTIIHHSDKQALFFLTVLLFGISISGKYVYDFEILSKWYSPNIIMLFYFVVGYMIVRDWQQHHCFKIVSRVLFVVLLIINIITNFFSLEIPSLLPLLHISLFCTLLTTPTRISKRILAIGGTKISEMSYGIYLSHFMLISALLRFGVFQRIPLYIEPLCMVIIVLISTMTLLWLLRKIGMKKIVM